jgi:hypothetical protein
MSERAGFLVAALAMVAMIASLSHRTSSPLSPAFTGASLSFLHVPLHGTLALFLLRALVPLRPRASAWPGLWTRHGLMVLSLICVHGVLDEIHQSFVPRRECSLFDVGLDVCGALVVLVAPLGLGKGRTTRVWHLLGVLGLAALLAFWLPNRFPYVDSLLGRWVTSVTGR